MLSVIHGKTKCVFPVVILFLHKIFLNAPMWFCSNKSTEYMPMHNISDDPAFVFHLFSLSFIMNRVQLS